MASKVNLALQELPERLQPRDGVSRARLHIGPSVDAIERAFDAAKYGELPSRPSCAPTLKWLPSGRSVWPDP